MSDFLDTIDFVCNHDFAYYMKLTDTCPWAWNYNRKVPYLGSNFQFKVKRDETNMYVFEYLTYEGRNKRTRPERDSDQPSYIRWDAKGKISYMAWNWEGEEHRVGGKPTEIHFSEGLPWIINYSQGDGLFHREDGPATTQYFKNGSIESLDFYLEGEMISPWEFYDAQDSSTKEKFLREWLPHVSYL